jgi:glutaredoxin 3
MTRLKIYSTRICPICDKAKALLKKWQIPFDEVRVDTDPAGLREFSQVTNGARTVPQITIDGKWIGSFSELTEMHMDDQLDELMPQKED